MALSDPYNPTRTRHKKIVVFCQTCGMEIPRDHRKTDDLWRKRKFCSLKCSAAKNPPPLCKPKNEGERFWRMIDKTGPNGCWLWTGSKDGHGYGLFHLYRQGLRRVHIIMADIVGLPGGDPLVLHQCDNTSCCNPGHLYRGTMEDNMRDRDSRGRWKDHWNMEKNHEVRSSGC